MLLGLVPDRAEATLRSHASGLPGWAEGLVLSGVRAFDRSWTARVEGGAVSVES